MEFGEWNSWKCVVHMRVFPDFCGTWSGKRGGRSWWTVTQQISEIDKGTLLPNLWSFHSISFSPGIIIHIGEREKKHVEKTFSTPKKQKEKSAWRSAMCGVETVHRYKHMCTDQWLSLFLSLSLSLYCRFVCVHVVREFLKKTTLFCRR